MSVEIGNFLRQARESAGLSLEELQEKTRIQQSFLEAIEKGDFDKLPSPFYVRTYLRSYANCVKVEPHYILREYRKMEQSERYQTGKFDASQLTATLDKLSQTGMHKFGFTGTNPKLSPTTSSSPINRTTATTALTIAKPVSQTGKLPMMKRREELAKTAKPQVISSSETKPTIEKKFPSLLPSQALTTRGDSLTGREKRFSTGSDAIVSGKQESKITAEQVAVTKSSKPVTTNQHAITGEAQTVPSRLNKHTGSSALSRTLANKRPTQPEQVVSPVKPEQAINKENTSPLSRASRLRNTSPSLTNSFVKTKENIQEEAQVESSNLPVRSVGGIPEVVSSDATEVKTLRRSAVHQMSEKYNGRFFSSRVIIASVVAVLLLIGIGWYLMSDSSDEADQTVKKETSTESTTSQEKKQPATPSSQETSAEPDLKKEAPGLYTLTGTNQAKVVIKPSGQSWVQIRDNNNQTASPDKYIKDVTLKAGDAALQYTHTFGNTSDLYIVLGSADNVEITVNDIPVKSAGLIHIVKK